MTELHIIKPESMELTMGWVIERIVEYYEKNGAWPDKLTTRPKNFVKICYYMDIRDLVNKPQILGIPLEIKLN